MNNKSTLFVVMITVSISWLSATIVYPIVAPLFLSTNSILVGSQVPQNIRSMIFGFFLTCFPLAQFLFAPIAGEYADRFGRKKAILITIFLDIVGYGLSGIGIYFRFLSLFFVGRFLMGMAAGNTAVCLAIISDISKDKKTKFRYFTYGSVIAGITFILGPLIGGQLSDRTLSTWFSPEFPMFVGMFLSILNFLIAWLFFKETFANCNNNLFDPMLAINNVGIALSSKKMGSIYLIYFLFLFSWNIIYLFVPAIMVERFESNSSTIGNVTAFMGIVWILGTCIVNFLLSYFCIKQLLLYALMVFFVSTVGICFSIGIYAFLLWISMIIFFAGGMWPIFNGIISIGAESKSLQGRVMGISQSLQSLSMIISPFLGGFFMHVSKDSLFVISAIVTTTCIVLVTREDKDKFRLTN